MLSGSYTQTRPTQGVGGGERGRGGVGVQSAGGGRGVSGMMEGRDGVGGTGVSGTFVSK